MLTTADTSTANPEPNSNLKPKSNPKTNASSNPSQMCCIQLIRGGRNELLAVMESVLK